MGISDATFYNWNKKFGALGVAEVRRLRQLKEALSAYFLGAQLLFGRDPRYENLIAAWRFAAASNKQLPNNVTLLTWNYDLNFESALLAAFSATSICQELVNSSPERSAP